MSNSNGHSSSDNDDVLSGRIERSGYGTFVFGLSAGTALFVAGILNMASLRLSVTLFALASIFGLAAAVCGLLNARFYSVAQGRPHVGRYVAGSAFLFLTAFAAYRVLDSYSQYNS